jgi:hypothetical protein
MKNLYLTFSLALIAGAAHAQLTQANNAPLAGESYQMYQCDSTGISAGSTGQNQNWNFSTLVTHTNILLAFSAVASSDPAFPGASIAVASSSANAMYFSTPTSTALNFHGGPKSIGTVKAIISYTSPAVYAIYPMSFNGASTRTVGGTYSVTSPFPSNGTFTGTSTALLDGTGTLVLPGANATFTDTYRLASSQTLVISSGNVISIDYNYYSPVNIKAPLLSISTATQNVIGTNSAMLIYRNKNASTGSVSTVGITENNPVSTSIFPNPSSDLFFVSVAASEGPVSVHVFDASGRLVMKETFTGATALPMGQQPAGIYQYHVINQSGKILSSGKLSKAG